MSRWSALLLAGSRPSGDNIMGHKALIEVAGVPMLLRPLGALLESPLIGTVCVFAQDLDSLRPLLPDDPRVELRQSLGTIADTIAELIKAKALDYPVLVTTADHALLDTAMIAEFIAGAEGADLAIAMVERDTLMRRFPNSKRTWIGFQGGRYSGANLFAFGSDKVTRVIDRWRIVEQDRKKGWRVLAALGPALLLGAVLKLRTVDESVAAVGSKLGLSIRAVQMSDPKAAIDVDKPADLELVEAILSGQA
ncbi:MAG: NTP transferase domain-containing protein [Sphingomicrobium sp.]